MKAIVMEADWEPRKGYQPLDSEVKTRTARNGSLIWKHPRMVVKDIPTPTPGPNEVLLEVKACGICGSDLHLAHEKEDGYVAYSATTRCPNVLGHEFSAVVRELGREAARLHPELKTGDIVSPCNVVFCGECTPCRNGFPNSCRNMEEFGFNVNGAFAEYTVIKAKACWKINELAGSYGTGQELYEVGALVEPTAVAYNGLFVSGGGFAPGAHVAVHGTGPIGLAAVALARAGGAAKVIAVDLVDDRLNIAKEVGADHVLNPVGLKKEGLTVGQAILDLTNGQGAEMHFEASGFPVKTIPEMEMSLSIGGKIVQVGRAQERTHLDTEALVTKGAGIQGSNGHAGSAIFPHVINLMATKRIDLSKVISTRLDLETAARAMTDSTLRGTGKTMAVM